MKIALLVRGFHFLRKDRFGFPLDGRRSIGSLQHRVITPLRRDGEVDLFLATYDSPIFGEIQRSLAPRAVVLPPVKSSTQVSTYLEGLNLIQAQQADYDRIMVTRFDLQYLKPVKEWNLWGVKGIFIPWREYEDAWRATHKVGDAIHAIDAPYVEAFKKGLGLLPRKNELHQLYDALAPLTPDVHFLEPGYYDSNTLYWNKECRNPLYRIANRPSGH
jgi:hypothetical protein